jgi:hypothetical protein
MQNCRIAHVENVIIIFALIFSGVKITIGMPLREISTKKKKLWQHMTTPAVFLICFVRIYYLGFPMK